MKKLLIVDDETDIATSIQYVLTQEGFSTLLAHDGLKAMELVEKEKPDLIILDLMMPGIDGLEVCRRVRSTDRRIPILMLTARTSSSSGGPRCQPAPEESAEVKSHNGPPSSAAVVRRSGGR